MGRKLINYCQTPQVTGLEYEEMRDLELHQDKSSKYKKLVIERTRLGKDFETPKKKKKRRVA